MSLIVVKNLTKTYKTFERGSGLKESLKSLFKRKYVHIDAVKDVSFEIPKGQICGILGPNGAGKSTAIKMLCGALFPSRGSIDVMGFSPARDRKKYVAHIGAVFGQKSQLNWDIPPIDSFEMNKAIYGIPDKQYKQRLAHMAKLLDVEDVMRKPTRVLSLGERMKCEFIMAILHGPKILFLDEPTIGLDVVAKTKIREFIREMNNNGMTCILTTHDLQDVEELAHRVIIINHGQKMFDDTLSVLKKALGDKKRVSLVLEKPYTKTDFENAFVVQQDSEYEITLEVDVSQISIGDFIDDLAKKLRFTDISIKELPMEQIITKLYQE